MGALAFGRARLADVSRHRADGFRYRARPRAEAQPYAARGDRPRARSGWLAALPMQDPVHRALARRLLSPPAYGKDRVLRPTSRFDVAPGRGRGGISRV